MDLNIANQVREYELEAQILVIFMHTSGILSLVTSFLAIYMILKKSTTQMGAYKYYLLNITVRFLN